MEQRIAWDDLPGPLKQAIAARTGPITGVRVMNAGQNSPLAADHRHRATGVFVKGLPSGHRKVITQDREAAVAPLVTAISPAMLWHFDDAGWNVLGYQYAPGSHADYRPGNPRPRRSRSAHGRSSTASKCPLIPARSSAPKTGGNPTSKIPVTPWSLRGMHSPTPTGRRTTC